MFSNVPQIQLEVKIKPTMYDDLLKYLVILDLRIFLAKSAAHLHVNTNEKIINKGKIKQHIFL